MSLPTLGAGAERLQVSDLSGLWHRSLLIDIDATTDTETEVNWLQGPAAFVDLRQPTGRPDFSGVSCHDQLSDSQRAWLEHQAGFAGLLVANGEFFEWRRGIDLQAPHATPDAGRLYYEGDVLIEKGWYEGYIEHWNAQPRTLGPQWAVHLKAGEGRDGAEDFGQDRRGLLVRVGSRFGWARRDPNLPGPDGVEIALGNIVEVRAVGRSSKVAGIRARNREHWIIERSSLPYREGSDLRVRLAAESLHTHDLTATGSVVESGWTIAMREGEIPL